MNAPTSLLLLIGCASCIGTASEPPGNPNGGGSTPPSAPSSLTADPMGAGLHLIWSSNSTNEDDFEIQRSQGADFAALDSVPFGTTEYHDATVAPGLTYTYRVRASNKAGPSGWSNDATATSAPPVNTADGGPGQNDGGSVTGWQPDSGTPNFQRDIVPILTNSCGAGSTSCHAPNAYFAWSNQNCRGWLSLTDVPLGAQYAETDGGFTATGCPDRTLYERLTQLQAWQCPTQNVTPGDPTRSYLWLKIIGGPFCSEAQQPVQTMPMGGTLDPNSRAAIEAWIRAGAPQ